MEDSVRENTDGRQGWWEVAGKTVYNHYFEDQAGGLDTTIAKLNAQADRIASVRFAADGGVSPAGGGYPYGPAAQPSYGYDSPQAMMTPAPEATPQAEAQARLTESRTTNTQTSNVQLHLPKGVSASTRRAVPGVTIVPFTGKP
jgi:hypothetical protein